MKILLMLTVMVLSFPIHALAGTVNVTSGSYHQDVELFQLSTGPVPTFSITYESLSWIKGSLGRGWTHTFDTSLRDNYTDSLLQIDLFNEHYIFNLKNGTYVPAEWDHSILTKDKSGAYILKREGITYFFDKNKQLTAIADSSGEKTTFIFTNGNMTKVVMPQNKTISLEYGDSGKLVRITDPAGKPYTVSYDDNGIPSAIGYPDGSAWRFTNDADGYMQTKTDRDGLMVTLTYDARHRLTSTVDSKGKTYTLNYRDDGEPVRTTTYSTDDEVYDYTYDNNPGMLLKKVDPKGGITTYTHDHKGQMTSKTDPANKTTEYTYDEHGRVTNTRDPTQP